MWDAISHYDSISWTSGVRSAPRAGYEEMMTMLRDSLRHYLTTGDMLHP